MSHNRKYPIYWIFRSTDKQNCLDSFKKSQAMIDVYGGGVVAARFPSFRARWRRVVCFILYLLPFLVRRTWYALNEWLFLLQILLHVSLLIFTLTQYFFLFSCSFPRLITFNSSLSSYSIPHSPRYMCVLSLE